MSRISRSTIMKLSYKREGEREICFYRSFLRCSKPYYANDSAIAHTTFATIQSETQDFHLHERLFSIDEKDGHVFILLCCSDVVVFQCLSNPPQSNSIQLIFSYPATSNINQKHIPKTFHLILLLPFGWLPPVVGGSEVVAEVVGRFVLWKDVNGGEGYVVLVISDFRMAVEVETSEVLASIERFEGGRKLIELNPMVTLPVVKGFVEKLESYESVLQSSKLLRILRTSIFPGFVEGEK